MEEEVTGDAVRVPISPISVVTSTISRRGLLAVTGFGALTAFVGGRPTIAHAQPTLDDGTDNSFARLSPNSGGISVVDQQVTDVFCDDWATLATVMFPTHLSLPGLSTAAVLSLSWDPRVFTVPTNAYTASDAMGQLQRATLTVDADAGTARIEVPASARLVIVPVGAKPQFPNELVAGPAATSYTLLSDEVEANAMIAPVLTPVNAWGAELLTLWSESLGVVYPVGVRVQSVGPEPTPSSLAILVGVDQRLDAALNVNDAVDMATANKRTEYRFNVGVVPAGAFRDIVLPEIDPGSAPAGQLRSPAVPYIRIAVDEPDTRGMRDTGKTSVAPLVSSGGPLSTYEEYESA